MHKFISIFLLVSAVTLWSACNTNGRSKPANSNVTVNGELKNCSGDTIYFVDVSSKEFKTIDSTIADENGKFVLYANLEHKGFYNVVVGRDGSQNAVLILGPDDEVKITGDAKNLGYSWSAEGSDDTKHFKELNDYMTGYEKKRAPVLRYRDSLLQVYQYEVSLSNNNKARIDSLDNAIEKPFTESQEKLDVMMDEGVVFVRAFIDKHPASFANIPALQLLDQAEDIAYFDKTVSALKAKYPSSPNVAMLEEMVGRIHKALEPRPSPFAVGQIPEDIVLQNPDGKTMKLSELRGKVVLIDFWASWCKPCRQEAPNVVAAYKKFNEKGFEVFSVSLDRDKQAWTQAIAQDKLTWKWHVLDNSEDPAASFATKYGASSIPRAFLLNREGKIIHTDVRGKLLTRLLEKELGN
ncbi:MAG: AhpC/TSA family protein [Bacteroidia bacterium]|jgi:thiol-disulfide isomerase/thioredoxin|nr:AhpC/TSA family protein [Bacteroidia bacterium]